MAKLRISGDSSGYVDLEAPNAASSSTLDLDQIPQKNATTTAFTGSHMVIGDSTIGNAHANADDLVIGNTSSGKRSGLTIVTASDQDGAIIWSDGTSSGNANIQGQLVYNHPDNSMRFYTAVSEGMRISGDGHVTTPKQPGFEVTLSSPTAAATGTYTIPFNTSRLNRGSHFDTATGVFTAPVAGFYHFDCQILLNGVSNTDDGLHVAFYQNSTHKSYFNLRAPGESANGSVGYGEYLPVIGTVSSYMNANDTMRVVVQAGAGSVGVHSLDWCSFSGFLIG